MKKYIPKHGDWVEVEINGVKIKNARVSVDNHEMCIEKNQTYICHNSRLRQGSPADNKLGFNYSYFLGFYRYDRFYINPDITNLKPAPPRKTKAEKVREARAKKKGKLPDTWRQVIDGMFRIEPTPNPYKELVEKVKAEINMQMLEDLGEARYFALFILGFIDQEEKKINK